MMRPTWGRLLSIMLCSVFLGAAVLQAQESRTAKVTILVSRNIRPYVEAVEGMSGVLAETAGVKVQVSFLDKFKGKSEEVLLQNLARDKYDLLIAVGPEASRFVRERPALDRNLWLYSMVLNPTAIFDRPGYACGISLDVPVPRQLEMIAQGLKTVKRLGLLYDPRYNAEVFMKAVAESPVHDLKIVPLRVSSKRDIPGVLKQNWENIDALWLIPDQTVISESIVEYIIKDALFKKIPVIGYNRFFYESGAAVAFIFNYEELGRQTGRKAANLLYGKDCEKESPVFRVWLNLRVIDKLGIVRPVKKSPLIEAGP